ncbi:MAG: DUF4129 domain-containing protein [Gaiellaceae bacterium]
MRSSAARALLPAVVVLALVAVVAVAATGSTPTGTGDSRPPAESLLDTIFSLTLLLLVPAAAILVYGLAQRKEIAREVASGRYRRTSFGTFVVFMAAFGAFVYFRLRDWKRNPFVDEIGEQGFPGERPSAAPSPSNPETYEPEFAWIPVLVVVGLVATAAAAFVLSARRRRAGREEEQALAEAIAAVLDDTLDDLRAEKDPRRAVIAAYARLELVLAAHRLARDAAETPEEYLTRILPELEVEPRSIRRLTDLFERAKFSTHKVDLVMKEEAIGALQTVRDELQAAEERRLEERVKALTAAAERA